MNQQATKYCKYCGQIIAYDAIFCVYCGRQVEEIRANQTPQVIVNNTNTNTNVNQSAFVMAGKPKDKWAAFLLCLFFGAFGVHKFYEGKVGMGILYLFTCGLFGIGWIVDCIALLLKPNPYYV